MKTLTTKLAFTASAIIVSAVPFLFLLMFIGR